MWPYTEAGLGMVFEWAGWFDRVEQKEPKGLR